MAKKLIERNRNRSELSNSGHLGRIPPQAIDLEEAVLGAMLLESGCIDTVLAILKPESFYKLENQIIYRAIKELKDINRPVDLLTVTNQLKKSGKIEEVGGPVYVTGLTSTVASSAHVDVHAMIVQDKFIQRELIRISSEILTMAYDESEDPLDIISNFNLNISNLLADNQVENAVHIQIPLKARLAEIEQISKNKEKLIGIPSGLSNLDRSTAGWQNSDLIIIAARPSQGKTAFSLFSSLQSSSYGFPVAFFSLEMSKPQLIDRALSTMSNISPLKIRTGRIEDHEWEQIEYLGVRKLENLPFYIDDTPALSLTQLRAKVMQLYKKHKIKLVVIDYLQLMRGEGDNREQEISSISRGLKALAKEVNIPIIALSQLNRAADGKRPVLSNLRESGAIEQDADMVIFIHRPEKYGQMTDENSRSTKGLVELIIDKQRNGPTGFSECYTNDYCTRFVEHQSELMDLNKPVRSFHEVDRDSSNECPY